MELYIVHLQIHIIVIISKMYIIYEITNTFIYLFHPDRL